MLQTIKFSTVTFGLAAAMSVLAFAPMAQAVVDKPAATETECVFTRSLTLKSKGADVKCLQMALIEQGYSIPAGATSYFGGQTKAAVIKWQKDEEITPAVGFFGSKSRAAFSGTVSTGGTTGTTGTTPPVVGTGTGLKVMLATDSPNGTTLVQGQSAGELAKFTFSNPTGAEIKVTNVTLKRIGVSTDDVLKNVYLFWGEKRITDSGSVSNSMVTFNDASGIFAIPAAGTTMVSVRSDIGGNTFGQQVGVSLASVGSTGTLDSSVALPVNGFLQGISNAQLATVALGTVTPTGGSFQPGTDITLFQTNAIVSTRAVWLKSITIENRGSTVDGDLTNIKLLIKGVPAGTIVPMAVNKKVMFDLSANPIRLETGSNDIRLQGDLVGGATQTFDFQIRRAADVRFVDVDLGAGITATGAFGAVTANAIDGVALTVSKASDSPSSNIAIGASSVKLAKFEFKATGDDLKIEEITVTPVTRSAIRTVTTVTATGAPVGDITAPVAATNTGLSNVKVFLNNLQIGSSQNITGATLFSFGSSLIAKAGATTVVEIYADTKTAAGNTLDVTTTAISGVNTVVTTSTAIDAKVGVAVAANATDGIKSGKKALAVANKEGNVINVTSSTLSASKYTGYGNQTFVPNTDNALIGSFTLGTGSTEGADVNTINVNFAASATVQVSSIIDNVRLYEANADGTSNMNKMIGSAKSAIVSNSSTVASANSFSVSGVKLAASATKVVNIVAHTISGAAGIIPVTTVSASGIGSITGNSVTSIASAALQTITVGSGILTATVSGTTPNSTNVIAGSADPVKVGTFRFAAQNSKFTVQELRVKVLTASAGSISLVTLKWPGGSASNTVGSNGVADMAVFTGLTFDVAVNNETSLDVYVTIPTIASGATSGEKISVTLDSASAGFRAVDSSGAPITAFNSPVADLVSTVVPGRGAVFPRKSIPTISAVGLTSTSLANGNKVLGSFKVAANSAASVSWNKIVFNVAKSAGITLGSLELRDSASNLIPGTFVVPSGAGSADAMLAATTAGQLVFEGGATAVGNEEEIVAGGSKTYEIRAVVAGVPTTGTHTIELSIPNPSLTALAANNTAALVSPTTTIASSFVWSDRSSITPIHSIVSSDWTNDYIVQSLPLSSIGSLIVKN